MRSDKSVKKGKTFLKINVNKRAMAETSRGNDVLL